MLFWVVYYRKTWHHFCTTQDKRVLIKSWYRPEVGLNQATGERQGTSRHCKWHWNYAPKHLLDSLHWSVLEQFLLKKRTELYKWKRFECRTCVMVSVRRLITTLHILQSCFLFLTASTIPPSAPKTASPKVSGDVGPQNPQLTKVSRLVKNLPDNRKY